MHIVLWQLLGLLWIFGVMSLALLLCFLSSTLLRFSASERERGERREKRDKQTAQNNPKVY